MRILMILSADGHNVSDPNGAASLLEWAAGPYYVFRDAGLEVVLASYEGGSPLEVSTVPDATADIKRLKQDGAALNEFSDTLRLDQVYAEDFCGVFLVGQPTLIPHSRDLRANDIANAMLKAGKPIATAISTADAFVPETGSNLAIIYNGGRSPIEMAHALLDSIRQRLEKKSLTMP